MVSKERRTAILINDMDLSRLMTYAEQLEAGKLRKRRGYEAKKAHINGKFQSTKGGRFHQGQGSSHVPSERFANDYPRPQEGGGVIPRPVCPRGGKGYGGPCLRATNACYSCWEVGYKMMDCPRNHNKVKDVHPQGRGAINNSFFVFFLVI
ncbi:MAG: hypothetical protein Q8853_02675 [Candidatus Phytoplasma australasiaticum]|nr:hypothetical protein [Candidatus Phytoplasma australasiaticum]